MMRRCRLPAAWASVLAAVAALLGLLLAVPVLRAQPSAAVLGSAGARVDVNTVQALWIDPDGRATADQAGAQRFDAGQAGVDALGRGQGEAVWVKFRLASDAARPGLLEVSYAHLDRLALYVRRPGGYALVAESGDHLRFGTRARDYRFPTFEVSLFPAPEDYLLRVQTRGAISFPLVLWDPGAFARAAEAEYVLLGAFFGGLAALVVLNLLLYMVRREPAHGSYALFAGMMSLFFWSENGLAFQFWFRELLRWSDRATLALIPFVAASGLLHARIFLRTAREDPRADLWLVRLSWTIVGLALVFPLFTYVGRFTAVQFVLLVVGPALLAAAWRALPRVPDRARFYLAGMSALLVGGGLYWAHASLGLGQGPAFGYALQAGYLIDAMVLSLGLTFSVRELRRAYRRLAHQFDALVSDQTERFRMARADLHGRMDQLRRRLVSRQDSLNRLYDVYERDHATGLPNRHFVERAWVARIEDAAPEHDRYALLHVRVEGLAEVNRERGSHVGDVVVRALGERLHALATDGVQGARLGPGEFAFLAGPRCDRGAAMALAAHIRGAVQGCTGNAALPEAPGGEGAASAALRAHVGICLYPRGASRLGWMLARAEHAALTAHQSGEHVHVFDPPREVSGVR